MTTDITRPLAARMRPLSLDQVVGQEEVIYPGSPLRGLANASSAVSILLYGPPGTGKTTIAQAIANEGSQRFVELSATSAGVKEVRQAISNAEKALEDGERTILFVDEIHRFSKAQQDILLPAVERGTVSLIGATTENPSFSVNAALMSRSVLIQLQPLTEDSIVSLLNRAVVDAEGLDQAVELDEEAAEAIAKIASGDARQALTLLETAAAVAKEKGVPAIDPDMVEEIAPRAMARYDRDGDQHYDIISAFIKSMRGSDPDAALHWMARMLEAGEDPRFIARRIVVHASEDVGMADPSVLPIAVAAAQAVQLIGMPEARINLAQAVIAIATAPKSPAVVNAVDSALQDVRRGRTGEVPKHLRDAHYPEAKSLGHGAGYLYPHDYPYGVVAQDYLPEGLDAHYYAPTLNGNEAAISKRMTAVKDIQRKGTAWAAQRSI